MIAVLPLPGAPRYGGDDKQIVAQALSDLGHYLEAGADAVVLENSHDLPYIKPPLPPRAVEVMKQVAVAVRRQFDGPTGIQVLEAANETALQIAHEADLDFLRVEGYVFAHVGGAGLIEGCAGRILRRRKELGSEHIKVFGDVKKKHCSHALTGDLDILDEVKQAEFFLVDGVIVTGARTTEPPALAELRRVQEYARVPVLIGSGITPENIKTYFSSQCGCRPSCACSGGCVPDTTKGPELQEEPRNSTGPIQQESKPARPRHATRWKRARGRL